MKQVFLIQAHRDLDQLNALVDGLRDDDFLIYVNLDRKCALDPAAVHPAAHQIRDRIDVHWGTFSQVQAVLNSLRQIVAEVPAFDKVVFLSAQDLPLLSNRRLKEEMARLRGRELLDSVAIGAGPGQWAADYRYHYFYVDAAPPALRHIVALVNGIVNRTMRTLGVTRHLPGRMQPYGGSSWWALSRLCVLALLGRIDRQPDLLRFFHRVACPDEMFFQTLVMDSPFGARVLGENFRYIQWPADGARNPEILDDSDFERIAASGAHFCRKIDSAVSARLIPLLNSLRAST